MPKRDKKQPRNEEAPGAWLRGGAGPHGGGKKRPYNKKRERRGNRIRPDEYTDDD